MKKIVGIIMLVAGIIGLIYGIMEKNSLGNQLAEAFGALTGNSGVSRPTVIIIVSAIVAVLGLVLALSRNSTSKAQ